MKNNKKKESSMKEKDRIRRRKIEKDGCKEIKKRILAKERKKKMKGKKERNAIQGE